MKPAHRSLNAQARPPLDFRLGIFFLWLLVLAAPFVLAPVAKESFREPKLLAGEWLVLASLTCFSWGLRRVAAVRLAGVDAEIVDVRTMAPLDVDTLCTSVCKTGRCVVVHEATRFSGYGAELVATVQEQCFWNLEAPVQRVTGWDTPYPHAFEWEYFPGPARIAAALKRVMEAG